MKFNHFLDSPVLFRNYFSVLFFITIKNPASAAIPNASEMRQLGTVPSEWVNPATMYARNEITAIEIAYGSCVATCFTWSHCAPALAIIVVSEIGEQWSPHTAPAIQAEIEIMRSTSPTGKIAMQIGMRIPNVPHDVPVANARKQAIMKMIAGRKFLNPCALPATTPAT